jgi:hypothetical protein
VHIKLPWGHLSIAAGLPKAIEYIGLCNPPTNHQPTIMYQLYFIYIISPYCWWLKYVKTLYKYCLYIYHPHEEIINRAVSQAWCSLWLYFKMPSAYGESGARRKKNRPCSQELM